MFKSAHQNGVKITHINFGGGNLDPDDSFFSPRRRLGLQSGPSRSIRTDPDGHDWLIWTVRIDLDHQDCDLGRLKINHDQPQVTS